MNITIEYDDIYSFTVNIKQDINMKWKATIHYNPMNITPDYAISIIDGRVANSYMELINFIFETIEFYKLKSK